MLEVNVLLVNAKVREKQRILVYSEVMEDNVKMSDEKKKKERKRKWMHHADYRFYIRLLNTTVSTTVEVREIKPRTGKSVCNVDPEGNRNGK